MKPLCSTTNDEPYREKRGSLCLTKAGRMRVALSQPTSSQAAVVANCCFIHSANACRVNCKSEDRITNHVAPAATIMLRHVATKSGVKKQSEYELVLVYQV